MNCRPRKFCAGGSILFCQKLTNRPRGGTIKYMKSVINVVGAAFVKDGKVFAAKRSYGSEYVIHKYEFVGGKIEEGERAEDALMRECSEEMELKIRVFRPIGSTVFEYPDKTVNITVFLCGMLSGYKVKEHEECRWLPLAELDESLWAPADREILSLIKSEFSPRYSLVTGATGYIGKAFCKELASRGENLFMTGRTMEKLAVLSAEIIKNYGVKVKYYPCDLTDEKSRAEFFSNAAGYTYVRLVNVAGADIQKAFIKYDEEKIIFQTRSLFEGAVSVTRFCLDYRAKDFSVINISSVSGLYPMPYFALYSALKGALTSFSVSLAAELKESGAKVTAVLPGAVYTRPDVIEYIKTQGLWGKIAAKSPQFIAKHSLRAAERGKVKYIPGFANKLMRAFTALIPQSLKLRFIKRKWSKTEKDAF